MRGFIADKYSEKQGPGLLLYSALEGLKAGGSLGAASVRQRLSRERTRRQV